MQEGSAPKPPAQQQPSGAPASNLDSFFKRLGQGQSSRLWAGPGRTGAVPGSLRTRLHPRDEDDSSGLNINTSSSTKQAATTESSAQQRAFVRNGGGARGLPAPAATTAGGGGGAAGKDEGDILNSDGTASQGRDRAAGAAGAGKNSERRRQSDSVKTDHSLSPLGTSGSWSELEGGSRAAVVERNEKNENTLAATFGRASSFGGRQSSSSSSLKHIVSALLSDHVPEEDPMSAPVSPSPTPPQPPTATAILVAAATAAAQLLPPTLSPAIVTAATAAPKPAAKPAARPASKPAARPAAKPAIAGGGAAPGAAAGAGAGLEDVSPSTELGSRPSYRDKRFDDVLGAEVVKLDELRKLSWNGVPPFHRPAVWQLLVGYMPANRARRVAALERKRREYREAVPQYFDVPDTARSHQEQNILRQILVDVPRTCPDVPFFHQEKVQRAMERILYIWAIRHPASGYVQGMNDLMTPLYLVFLSAHVEPSVESTDVSKVESSLLDEVEADVYWCLTKLLDKIQDHYTAMQPGLHRMVLRLEELVQRIDADLHRHITEEGLLYIQFAFRWMNCLLMRELPQRAVVRAWDTYLAEDNGFESFHVYVSAALLCHFSSTLREMDFQSMVMFLQDMPTKEWGEDEVEPLLSQAYILSTLFEGSPNHLGAS